MKNKVILIFILMLCIGLLVLVSASATEDVEQTELDIVQTVLAYTSGELSGQLNAIITNYTGDEMVAKANELFQKYGFSDYSEGMEFLRNATERKGDYTYLTNSEIYAANNYWEKLNNDFLMKATLGTAAFIIGGEYKDYFDISTYLQSDYPAVAKYKSALLSFMELSSPKLKALETAKVLQKTFANADKVALYEITQELNNCATEARYQLILDNLAMKEVYAQVTMDDEHKIEISKDSGFGKYAEAMKIAGDVFSISGILYEDFSNLLNLDATLNTYSVFREFLLDIIRMPSDSCYFELKWAAQLIVDEMDRKYQALADDFVLDLISIMYSTTGLDDIVLDTLKDNIHLGANTLGDYLLVVDVTSFVINSLADVGGMVEKSATVEAYAMLADHWTDKLAECAAAFRSSKTEENAWDFAYNYEILRLLRLQGEKAYLDMCKVEGILNILFDHQYETKEENVQPTIDSLEQKKIKYIYVKAKGPKIVASGYCGGEGDGRNLKWTLDENGTLKIFGTGKMKDFIGSDSVSWYTRRNSINEVLIGSNVYHIGSYAFYGCSNLTSIVIPDAVTSIEERTFFNCRRLTSINIPDRVISIGDYAFSGCDMLTNVQIPRSVKSIGKYAFQNCNRLTEIVFPDSVTSIGTSVLSGCSRLTNITIPFVGSGTKQNTFTFGYIFGTSSFSSAYNVWQGPSNSSYYIPNSLRNVTVTGGSIPDYAFYECNKLINITIPDTTASIGNYAFFGCNSLSSITIPKTVTLIGDYAFYSCGVLNNVTIMDGLKSIGAYAFSECRGISSIILPDSVADIKQYAFCGCTALKSIVIPNGVKGINDATFFGCTKLANVTLQKGVVYIGNDAFFNCGSLTSITLPNGVTSIGSGAFYNCTSLASITIPNEVTSIGGSAFGNCTDLANITLPNSINSIGRYAFSGCTGLTSIVIPNCLTNINEGMFYKCDNLENVILPDSVTNIDRVAFFGCASIQRLTIPTSVTSIGEDAFGECTKLLSITLPNGITNIDRFAFFRCTSLTSITLPNSTDNIDECAFSECTNLTNIAIPNGVTSINTSAFSNCTSLTSISLPDGLISIGRNAFGGCINLGSITIPNSVTNIGDNAFYGCTSLTTIALPASITSIGDSMLCGCTNLTSIEIPAGVTSIGDYAFCDCASLTSVTLPNSVKSIGEMAFIDCTSLQNVYFLGSRREWKEIYLDYANGRLTSASINFPAPIVTFSSIYTDNSVELEVYVVNFELSQMKILCAFYDEDGRMLDAVMTDISQEESFVTFQTDKPAASSSVFLVDAAGIPQCEAVTVTIP